MSILAGSSLHRTESSGESEILAAQHIDLFYGASQTLYDVSIRAVPGEICCILGRNGTGKTSLLGGLAGQLPCRNGTLHLGGLDLSRALAPARARAGIAIVPQGREIFPSLSVLENLQTGFACLPRSARAIPTEIYELFPVLREMLHRRGGDLSGGQQQQLAIARALVTRPRVLMLDEPTEGIQPSVIKDIGRVISALRDRGDMAILLVEQYLDFAWSLADRIVVMDRGRVVVQGATSSLSLAEVRRHITV